MIKFEITKQMKRKARRRRQRTEDKWKIFRILSRIFGALWLPSLLIAVFVIPEDDYVMLFLFIIIYAVLLISYVIVKGLLMNLTSHWIQDRLNERLWIENGILYHFVQTAFAAGRNIRRADSTAWIFQYNLSTIRNAKYDPDSGRIEFNVDGKSVFYHNYYRNVIDSETPFHEAPTIFYEYMKPSLYTYLKNEGVEFELKTLDFKIRDPYI